MWRVGLISRGFQIGTWTFFREKNINELFSRLQDGFRKRFHIMAVELEHLQWNRVLWVI